MVLDDACMEGIRAEAYRERRDMSSLVNELLGEGLRRRRERSPLVFTLPSFSMGQPRVNIADRDELERAMEDA